MENHKGPNKKKHSGTERFRNLLSTPSTMIKPEKVIPEIHQGASDSFPILF